MRIIILCLLFLATTFSATAQKEIRTQMPYDLGRSKTISNKWSNDSITPFRISGDYLEWVEIYSFPGLSKDELFDKSLEYLTNKYGQIADFYKEQDRNSGRIAGAFTNESEIRISAIFSHKYRCSRTILVEVKDSKTRITYTITHLVFGIAEGRRIDEPIYIIDDDIAKCYPLNNPKKKKPNYWEKLIPRLLRMEISDSMQDANNLISKIKSKKDEW